MKQTAQGATVKSPRELTLTRTFNVPREIVFRAWTDPHQVAQWWGPKQFTNPRCEWNARAGGKIRVDMRGPGGNVHPMGGAFREVVPYERLVFTTTAFYDDENKPILENLNVVTFEEHGGGTKMTVHVTVLHAAPEAELPLSGMKEGWSSSLDKLAELLTAAKK